MVEGNGSILRNISGCTPREADAGAAKYSLLGTGLSGKPAPGETRTRQFWRAQHLLKTFGTSARTNQGWLIAPPGLEQLPAIPLNEPTRRGRLKVETDLFGFAVSEHPVELSSDVAWDTMSP